MDDIEVLLLRPNTPEVTACARWRCQTFDVLNTTFDEELASMASLAADQSQQAALIAKCNGALAGTCLLVKSEIEPNHALSPWLAGLFVVPEHRRKGAGAALVRAVEEQARLRRHARLYLYTDDAVGYYQRLNWYGVDRTMWKGYDTTLMARDL